MPNLYNLPQAGGLIISERRKAKGWTQSQLAEKLEITDEAVSKWETGVSHS